MLSAKVTSKGQITIPVEVRRAMGLKPGSRITFVETEKGSFTLRAKTGSIMDLYGILAYDGPPISIEEMDQAVLDAAAENYLDGLQRDPRDEEAA